MGTRVEGVTYTPEAVQEIREALGTVRDGFMDLNDWHSVVMVTWAIAYLAEYADLLASQEDARRASL